MVDTIVRKATIEDLLEIATIHKRQFPGHYLGHFSVNLLMKFYGCFFLKPNIFLVSETDGKISGFILGGKVADISACTSSFIKDNTLLYAKEILFRPATWMESVRKFFGLVSHSSAPAESLDNIMEYTLLSIAVSPKFQGKKVSQVLMDAFDEKMKSVCQEYFLSVRVANARAIHFYEKVGFVKKITVNGEHQFIKSFTNN